MEESAKPAGKGKVVIKERLTLGETVFKLIQEGNAHSEDYEKLRKYYGDKRLKELYDAEKKKNFGL